MERLNVSAILADHIDVELRREMVVDMLAKNLQTIEKLMTSTTSLVRSPMSYNHCASLLEQLGTYMGAAYLSNCDPILPVLPDGQPVTIVTQGA